MAAVVAAARGLSLVDYIDRRLRAVVTADYDQTVAGMEDGSAPDGHEGEAPK